MSWKSRNIKRRDYRHDHEALADAPCTGKVRSKRHRPSKHHVHNFREIVTARSYYSVYRCPCGKKEYKWRPLFSRRRPAWSDPTRQAGADPYKAEQKFFPIHDEGTCKVCDE